MQLEDLKDLIIYQSQNNENISVEVLYNEEDFWLTQNTDFRIWATKTLHQLKEKKKHLNQYKITN